MAEVSSLLQQAVKHHQGGNLYQAELLYRQILQSDPRHVDALHLLGVIAQQAGRSDLALNYIGESLRLHPHFPLAHHNIGLVLYALGRFDEAIRHLRESIRLRPDNAEAYNNLGNALREVKKLDEACANYRQALRLQPNYAEAHNSLGNVLRDLGNLSDAIENFHKALQLKPDLAETRANLGNAFRAEGNIEQAINHYQEFLYLKPESPEGHNNMGNALRDQGKLEKALASFDEALRLNADYADAHFNRALPLLALGRFEEGWPEYEWRWKVKGAPVPGNNAPKVWDGSPLEGRTVLLQAEPGLGDTIQFMRYAALLKQHGAGRVLLACPPELLRLMKRCQGVDQVLAQTPTEGFDIEASLLTLPRLLGTTSVERIPGQVPYLDCDADQVARWRSRLARQKGLRVGIAWQGGETHEWDRWRSVPLKHFAPLAERAGVRLVSLQKGFGREQLENIPGLAVDLGPELIDLADTAAVVRCLDLVITVDTALAHLAGALGSPVWVALPMVADWRWLLDREDSPWYPTMRLFRQTTSGDWDEVFQRIASALAGIGVDDNIHS